MKAVRFHEPGGPEVLKYEDAPTPEPGTGQVQIRVKACSLNRVDIWVRSGLYKTDLPHILGADFSGDVSTVGHGVSDSWIGQKVLVYPGLTDNTCPYCLAGEDSLCDSFKIIGAAVDGGYAEYAVVPQENVFSIPEDITYDEAAALPVVFLTAWHMLITRAALRVGERILIHAAGSGIGSAAIQIAKLAGAEVFTTAGSERKLSIAAELGADHLIDYNQKDFAEEVMSITGGAGVDLVFEHTGAATFPGSMSSLKKGGRLVTAGATTGDEGHISIRQLYGRQLTVIGSMLGTRREMLDILPLVAAGKLKPVIDRILPLSDAAKAHEMLMDRQQFGKIILRP